MLFKKMFEKPLIRKDLSKKEYEFRSYDRKFLGHPKISLKGYVTELDRIQVKIIQNSIKENDVYNHNFFEFKKNSLCSKKNKDKNNLFKISNSIKSSKNTTFNNMISDSLDKNPYTKKLYFKAVQTIPLDIGSLRFQEKRNPNT